MTTATLQTPPAGPTIEPQPAAAGAEPDVDVHAVTIRRTDEPAPWTGQAPSWVWQCTQACYPDGVAHMRPRQALSHALTHAAARLHLTVESARLEQFFTTVLSHEQQLADDTPAAAAGILIDPAHLRVHELAHPTPAVAT